jgi:uncharacterized protein GlcG (DUF336 family)
MSARRLSAALCLASLALPVAVFAQRNDNDDDDNGNRMACRDLPSHTALRTALRAVAPAASTSVNGGFNLNMWASIVNRDGIVCAVVFTGDNRGDQWPGSRVISAQKANTANAFSLRGFALSTANLYQPTQPGGTLYGLQESNPVDTEVAYGGNSSNYGQNNDPMVGRKIGGINIFGGGLALYNPAGNLIGAIGVSGDTSCTDHIVAWKTRHRLNLDNVPNGPSGTSGGDNIIHPSTATFGHPTCDGTATSIGGNLPVAFPLGPAQ